MPKPYSSFTGGALPPMGDASGRSDPFANFIAVGGFEDVEGGDMGRRSEPGSIYPR